uniref:Uncharacterized protein n=1 Tax=Oryza meridionalis TaxID=40149 RepID=A0A0E0EAL5_9ORYZ
MAVGDVVAGLPPGALAPPPAIHGAAVNAHPRLHLRGRLVRPSPAPQLRRGPSPGGAFIAGRRSRCESGPSSYPSAILGEQRDKMGSWASRCRGIVAGGRVLPRPHSTLNPNLVTGSRILPRPRSTSELVAGDRVLRRELVTSSHVRRPRLGRWLRPPCRSSSPAPPPSPRRILRHPCPTPELVAGAISVTTQILRRPCDHAPRRSSAPEVVGVGRVRAAGLSRICAAPTVACALTSEGVSKELL